MRSSRSLGCLNKDKPSKVRSDWTENSYPLEIHFQLMTPDECHLQWVYQDGQWKAAVLKDVKQTPTHPPEQLSLSFPKEALKHLSDSLEPGFPRASPTANGFVFHCRNTQGSKVRLVSTAPPEKQRLLAQGAF